MRRGSLTILLAVFVVITGHASAGGLKSYSGPIDWVNEPTGTISFKAAFRDGVPRRVSAIRWTGFEVDCDQGADLLVDGKFPRTLKVRRKSGKFFGRITDGVGGKIDVQGLFREGKDVVLGSLKFRHWNVDAAHTDCIAGGVLWKAD